MIAQTEKAVTASSSCEIASFMLRGTITCITKKTWTMVMIFGYLV
jgi:hypothetical protein